MIVDSVDTGAGPILCPAARDRSGDLADRLLAEGYDIGMIEAYQADMATRLDSTVLAALRSGAIGGILFYSRRTAQAFRAIVDAERLVDALEPVVLYALSAQVAAVLAGLGRDIRVAAGADEASLFALLPKTGQ